MKRRIYVKPVAAGTELFGWLTLELTLFESFFDDWKRAGLRIALGNLFWMIGRMVGLQ